MSRRDDERAWFPGGGGAPQRETKAAAAPWHGVMVAVGQHAVDALIDSAFRHVVQRDEALRACRASHEELAGLGVGEAGTPTAPSVVRPERARPFDALATALGWPPSR